MSINIPTAYKAKVTPPFGELGNLINWCKNNCTGDWRFMEDPDDQWNSYIFFFDTDRDYTAFYLWHK